MRPAAPANSGEVKLLQAVIAILALIPISAGVSGIVLGPAFLEETAPWPVDLDSHVRFLSGVFLAVGLAFMSTVPSIATQTSRFRLLATFVFVGGLARLLSLLVAGTPSTGHVIGLVSELVVVPLLVVWQARVATRTG